MKLISRPINIVCLHGKSGNGVLFKRKIQKLIDYTSDINIDWHFPDAPYNFQSPTHDKNTSDINHFEWWTLPPNTRSFTALEYQGNDLSIKLVEEFSPDVLVGHSQGAILSSIILARAIKGVSLVAPKAAILSGAAWPNPYTNMLEEIKNNTHTSNGHNYASPSSLSILHTLCKTDPINPYESGLRLAECFSQYSNNDIRLHDNGHNFCTDDTFLELYRKLLLGVVVQVCTSIFTFMLVYSINVFDMCVWCIKQLYCITYTSLSLFVTCLYMYSTHSILYRL